MRFGPWAARWGVVALLGSVTTVAMGNAAPPDEPPPVRRKVMVRQSNDQNYRIVIPVSMLKELKIAANDLDFDLQQPTEESGHRSLLAALAISAGMFSLVFIRRKSTSTKVLMVMAVTGAAYFASHAYADLGPPSRRPSRPPSKRPATKPAPNRPVIEIETTRRSHSVILYVPAANPAAGAAADGPPLGGAGSGSPNPGAAPDEGLFTPPESVKQSPGK